FIPCCWLGEIGVALFFGLRAIQHEGFLMRYYTGERFQWTVDTPAIHSFWNEALILALSNCLYLIALYSVVVWKFRAKLTHTMRNKSEAAEDRRAFSLLCIAVMVVGFEVGLFSLYLMICLTFQTVYTLFYWYFFDDINSQVTFSQMQLFNEYYLREIST
ncbi:hypothetical protein PENTCL1PPCAC_14683, partial [Pristionchus entomophagus]